MENPYPLEALIGWRPAIEAECTGAYKAVLADASFRQRLKDEMKTTGVPNRFSSNNWDHMTIMSAPKRGRPLRGQRQICAETGDFLQPIGDHKIG